jgi:hypothetical protein
MSYVFVILAKARISFHSLGGAREIPAFTGMTLNVVRA